MFFFCSINLDTPIKDIQIKIWINDSQKLQVTDNGTFLSTHILADKPFVIWHVMTLIVHKIFYTSLLGYSKKYYVTVKQSFYNKLSYCKDADHPQTAQALWLYVHHPHSGPATCTKHYWKKWHVL